MKTRAWSWPAVVSHYRSLPWAREMAELAEAIAGSRHGVELYPAASMHTLLIAQAPVFDPGEGVLHIAPVVEPGPRIVRFRFAYVEAPFARGHWEHEYPVSEGPPAFERFIRRAHWFVEYHSPR